MSSYFTKLDYWVWGPVAVLGIMSLLAIGSAAPRLLISQIMWMGIGIMIALLLCVFDLRPLVAHRAIIMAFYGIAIALLVATVLFAPVIRGSRAWLVLGPVQFQASEFAKIALIIALSYFFARRHVGIAYLGNLVMPIVYAAIPIALILLEPDMGSAIIVGCIAVGYLLVSGIRWRHLFLGAAIAAVVGMWGWNNFLADYQKERIIGLFYPERDPLGVNYNVIQSKIAIGSGGFWGKGFQQGTQVQLGFLPEAHNDFVFATIIEEWGMVGGVVVLSAVVALLLRIAAIGLAAQQNFSRLLCLGTMIVLLAHLILNMGSTLGIVPVIGVSLPFVSYGGSNLIMNFLLIGIVQSIALRESF